MSREAAGTGRAAVRLLCTVRGCAEPLGHESARLFCARNHSFDQHRSGALNLLQPQDRRSKTPGDSREAAEARHLLAGLGHADAVQKALGHAIAARATRGPATVLDVGCGEGAFLRHLSALQGLERVLRAILTATYRGFRQSERAAVESLSAMTVTLSHDVRAFQRH